MRLFNRAKEDAEPENAPATLPGIAPAGGADAAGPHGGPADAPGPDAALLDATVKEMSEKIARLTSSLDAVGEEKQTFEDKIQRMEDRMRKLSSLTEMLSAQYNPFIGDAPSERAPVKAEPDAGKAASATAVTEPVARPPDAAAPAPDAADPERMRVTVDELPPEPEEAFFPPADEPTFPEPEAPDAHAAEDATEPAADAEGASPHPQLDRVQPGFQSNMLLLNWSNALLKAAGSREGLQQVVRYYESLGWIGRDVADVLASYAEGLACDDDATRDWRADVELHERSLLFIEKLKGRAG